jgi:hypothetical protein
VTKRKPGRSGLDRERARRRELDRSKVELRLPELAKRAESSAPLTAVDAALAPAGAPAIREANTRSLAAGVRLPGQHVVCLWCRSSVAVRARGPLPKFCSATCRHRAWEQERAARSGRVAVVAVDRFVIAYPDDIRGWVAHLERLATDVRRGQLDEAVLVPALDLVYVVIANRQQQDQPRRPVVKGGHVGDVGAEPVLVPFAGISRSPTAEGQVPPLVPPDR